MPLVCIFFPVEIKLMNAKLNGADVFCIGRFLLCASVLNGIWCFFQGGRFMSTAMYDAREALIPGSAYDRSNGNT